VNYFEQVHLLSFLVVVKQALLLPLLKNTCGMNVKDMDSLLSPNKMLWLHFFIGHSYNLLKLVGRGIATVTHNAFKFQSMTNMRTYRDALPVGPTEFFTNPEGKSIGRVWPHHDMLVRVFENEAIVSNHNFFLEFRGSDGSNFYTL
jgi:hypothetical protein